MNARRSRLAEWIALQSAAAVPNRMDHAIEEVRTFPLREPVSGRSWTVVRVRTRSGLTGWGESPRVPPDQLIKARQALNGRPATAYAVHSTGTLLDGGINMALLDITGKACSAPVYRLLGGPTRFKARALTRLNGASDAELASSMKFAHQAGYRAFQVSVPLPKARNQGQAFDQAVRARMDALRAAAPSGANFVLDAEGLLSAGDAASVAASFERFHLLWFNEPCGVRNLRTIQKIAEECVTPLGFGRDIDDPSVYQDLLREGVADILRPEVRENGISGVRRIATMAETYYTAVAPNHEGGPIATAAALHLAACLPNFFIQHIPVPAAEEDRRMRAEIVRQPVETVRDGFADLPAGPGLGIEVNESALERYREAA